MLRDEVIRFVASHREPGGKRMEDYCFQSVAKKYDDLAKILINDMDNCMRFGMEIMDTRVFAAERTTPPPRWFRASASNKYGPGFTSSI